MNIHKQISNHLPFNGKLINRVMAGYLFFFFRVLCYFFYCRLWILPPLFLQFYSLLEICFLNFLGAEFHANNVHFMKRSFILDFGIINLNFLLKYIFKKKKRFVLIRLWIKCQIFVSFIMCMGLLKIVQLLWIC